jgi:hypothetical protein
MEVVDVEKVGLEEACVGREESALFFQLGQWQPAVSKVAAKLASMG